MASTTTSSYNRGGLSSHTANALAGSYSAYGGGGMSQVYPGFKPSKQPKLTKGQKKAKKNAPFIDRVGNLPRDPPSTDPRVNEWREEFGIATAGNSPDPILTFAEANVPDRIMQALNNAKFDKPSHIQAQAWSPGLQGRDVIGVAKTGSGKTLGFLYPAFLGILNRKWGNKDPRYGPTVLVLAPTRELAVQIQEECIKFGQSSGIYCTCVYGGSPKGPQLGAIRRGVHIVIATPGRLNDFLEQRQIHLNQVSYLVFDEADRMLDMGFEPQIRRIIEFVPPSHQTLFFTATWPKEVRRIASEFLRDPVIIYVGNCDDLKANPDINQIVHVIQDYRQKDDLLERIIKDEGQGARILVFCSTKRMCDNLERNLRRVVRCAAIHGDKDQSARTYVLDTFKNGQNPVMIATDVAARGIDVKDVRAVINYDFPTNVEDYVHRIGRTGRAGNKGNAYTFFEFKDAPRAADLIKLMEEAGSSVPDDLRSLASRRPQARGSNMQFSSSYGSGGSNGGRYGGGGYNGGGGGYSGGGSNGGYNGSSSSGYGGGRSAPGSAAQQSSYSSTALYSDVPRARSPGRDEGSGSRYDDRDRGRSSSRRRSYSRSPSRDRDRSRDRERDRRSRHRDSSRDRSRRHRSRDRSRRRSYSRSRSPRSRSRSPSKSPAP